MRLGRYEEAEACQRESLAIRREQTADADQVRALFAE
jgi:hypothetical protein